MKSESVNHTPSPNQKLTHSDSMSTQKNPTQPCDKHADTESYSPSESPRQSLRIFEIAKEHLKIFQQAQYDGYTDSDTQSYSPPSLFR